MGFEADERCGADSTPKLSLSKLPPCKPREPIQMLTPPLHPSISIPFQWEEVPGKPRYTAVAPPSAAAGNKAVRCLDLPPRLMSNDDTKITAMPSPATVLDGPYVGRSLSLACSFSFRKGPAAGRWGSSEDGGDSGRCSFEFSHPVREVLRSEGTVKKAARVGRARSFFNLYTQNYSLEGICSSIKRAVVAPWRRRRRRDPTVQAS